MNPREALREAVRRNELKRKELEEKDVNQSITQTSENVGGRRKIIRKENSDLTESTVNLSPHIQESNIPLMVSENFQNNSRKPPQKALRFDDTHKRFTNYLQRDLYAVIQKLRANGEIDSMTLLINDAVFEYLAIYFPNEMKLNN